MTPRTERETEPQTTNSVTAEARTRGFAVWRALVAPVRRTLPWGMLGAGGAAGLLLAALPRLFEGGFNAWLTLNLLRAAALAFAMGLAFLLDDPARDTTAAVPTPRPVRQTLRAALVAPLAALWWTAALLLVPAELRPPVGGITLEAAATLTLALAAAAAALRFGRQPRPGIPVAAGLLFTATLAPLLLPNRWTLFAIPKAANWQAAHDRWSAVLVAAVVVWAACGPEPLRRRRFGRFFSPSGA
ncbi:ABC transporter [Streptomyces sp. NBC_00289]|uniref:ABC transporter n=1 Tax=Streptomyces sp. NBC_00289 TaxID=2975703 RepID=UPI00352F2C2D